MLVIRMEHMERSGDKRTDLKLPEKSLVVFVDDTGHERLVEDIPSTASAAAPRSPATPIGSSGTRGATCAGA